jgi:AAA+ superfamily predicted ATPase
VYFVLFAAIIYFLTGNWLYGVSFSLVLSGFLGNLCENNLARALGFLASLPVGFIWIGLNNRIIPKLLLKLQHNINSEALTKVLDKVNIFIVPNQMRLLLGVTFVIGFIIITSLLLQLSTILPKKFKFPKNLHVFIIFVVNFIRLILSSILICILLRWVLAHASLPVNYAYLVLIFPFLFIFKTWSSAKECVTKQDEANDSKQDEDIIQNIVIPNLKLSDVAGMTEVKDEITLRMILPLKNPSQAAKYGIKAGGGVLLYGPPGTGKTYFAKAVAGELKIPFYAITAADIFSKYVGESENNVKKIFESLRKHPMAVLFIDELESIFRKRSDDIHETTRKIISVLLQELDGISSDNTGLLLIGATNAPHLIDEAFLRTGRFDAKIFVGLPDKAARKQILEACFSDVKLPIEEGLLDLLAECAENFSGADLKGFAQKVKQRAFATQAKKYTRELFQECLSGIYPSSNKDLMHHIREWERSSFGR